MVFMAVSDSPPRKRQAVGAGLVLALLADIASGGGVTSSPSALAALLDIEDDDSDAPAMAAADAGTLEVVLAYLEAAPDGERDAAAGPPGRGPPTCAGDAARAAAHMLRARPALRARGGAAAALVPRLAAELARRLGAAQGGAARGGAAQALMELLAPPRGAGLAQAAQAGPIDSALPAAVLAAAPALPELMGGLIADMARPARGVGDRDAVSAVMAAAVMVSRAQGEAHAATRRRLWEAVGFAEGLAAVLGESYSVPYDLSLVSGGRAALSCACDLACGLAGRVKGCC